MRTGATGAAGRALLRPPANARTHGPRLLPDAYFFCGAAADARRGERRGRALPDGDREREV